MCSGRLIASNTSRRGASNSRVMRISRSDGVVTAKVSLFFAVPAAMGSLLALQRLQITFEPVEARLPQFAVALGPVGNLFERRRFEATRPPLRLAGARDQ